jgi:hypothetical protein
MNYLTRRAFLGRSERGCVPNAIEAAQNGPGDL